MFLNRRHAKRREELGKNAVVVDESMLAKNQVESGKVVEIEEGGTNANNHKALEDDNAMQDMTDIKNEDFIYVY